MFQKLKSWFQVLMLSFDLFLKLQGFCLLFICNFILLLLIIFFLEKLQ